MRLRSLATASAVLLAAASTAGAQTNFSQAFSFPSGPAVPVSYMVFDVTTVGTFNFYTNSVVTPEDRPDPYLRLFAGRPDALGAQLGADDDGCDNNTTFCLGSSNFFDSFVRLTLDAGSYSMAVSRFHFTEAEARAGYADVVRGFDMTLHVTSQDGTIGNGAALGPVVAPEPGTWALMGSGLLGLAGVARRRRASA